MVLVYIGNQIGGSMMELKSIDFVKLSRMGYTV